MRISNQIVGLYDGAMRVRVIKAPVQKREAVCELITEDAPVELSQITLQSRWLVILAYNESIIVISISFSEPPE